MMDSPNFQKAGNHPDKADRLVSEKVPEEGFPELAKLAQERLARCASLWSDSVGLKG